MTASNDSTLRALIRLLPPARALKDRLEESLELEQYEGTGDLAVQSVKGLRDSVNIIQDDPYIQSLGITADPDTDDREKVSTALLVATQLAAYLEGETGLSSSGHSHKQIQTAPSITLNGIHGVTNEVIDKMVNLGADAMEDENKDD